MSIKVAINGFGRIGRLVFRALYKEVGVDIVAINDLTDANTLAHLLKYDSVHGRFGSTVRVDGNKIYAGREGVTVYAERDPRNLPWKELDVDVVVESTGVFRDRKTMNYHIEAGAKKVLLSAPAKDTLDNTVVLGVNDDTLAADQLLISNASCTTNCLAPIAKVLNDNFGIRRGWMTTIHGYTNDQRILDLPHSDLRRARSAAINIIPTTTGAAAAVGLVIPELKGKLDGFAMRVPVPDGSLVDLVAELDKDTTAEEINAVMKAAAEGPMKGVLEFSIDPLVSTDIIDNPHSSIFDSLSTRVMGGNLIKVVSWYDNEWGYSSRTADLVKRMATM